MWSPPETLPVLEGAACIAIDLETRDPGLKQRGPGGVRGEGYVVGVAVAVPGWKAYLPVSHEGGGNLDSRLVFRWLQRQLSLPCPKVGAHIIYDLEWLGTQGIHAEGTIIDVLNAQALLDENRRSYSLETVAQSVFGLGKTEDQLDTNAREYLHLRAKDNVKEHLWRLPARLVGEYAEQDALLALMLWQHFAPRLNNEGLDTVWRLECQLQPMLLAMRQLGVRVDVNKAEQLKDQLLLREISAQSELERLALLNVNVWSSESLEKAFTKQAIPFPRTELGAPSFTRSWLESQDHPLAKAVMEVRRINRLRNVFVEKMILKNHVNGRVYTQFHPMRGDDGGAVTGRFSSSHPNLQQVPARDPELSPLVRGLFLPDEGGEWGLLDYSQIEPRLLIHYAAMLGLRRSAVALGRFINDPTTDYHQMVADMTSLERRPAKTINLGLIYGMGKAKLAKSLDLPLEEAEILFKRYHAEVPFVRALGDVVGQTANERGYVKTLLGRRRRFNQWEPARRLQDEGWSMPQPYDTAVTKWDGYAPSEETAETIAAWRAEGKQPRLLRRAYTHKAMNAVIQGSAADVMKQAMVLMWQEKLVPHLTVHDEVDLTLPPGEDGTKTLSKIKEIMEHAIELVIPLLVKTGRGPTWGESEHD